MLIYVSGSMSSKEPDRQMPEFKRVTEKLRGLGHEVANPAEWPMTNTWTAAMRRCLDTLRDCDAITLLPRWRCGGALVEALVAATLGLKFVDENANEVGLPEFAISAGEVLEMRKKHG